MKDRDLFGEIFPPDESRPWPHYKNGFKAFGAYPLTSKIAFFVSLLSLAVSLITLASIAMRG